MSQFVVMADGLDKNLFENFKNDNRFQTPEKPKLTPQELDEVLPKTNALVIRSATTVNQELLDKAPNLRYVIRAGEGTDNIDKVACEKRGVKVSNTPGANNNSAAEHAISLMMSLLRHTPKADASMKKGKWEKPLFVGTELWKKKIGIIGMGRIGQIVAKRLSGFEPEIIFYDPFLEKSPFDYATKVESIKEVCAQSDIVTVHVPLSDKTRGLITQEHFAAMRPGSFFVNASRGHIVSEQALIDALKEGKIKGAGLDVFDQEPLPEGNPFSSLDNIILTPHVGASTHEAQERVGEMVIHQLESFLINNELLNEVKA